MRAWWVIVIAACGSKSESQDHPDWQVIALPASFATHGAIRAPKGTTLEVVSVPPTKMTPHPVAFARVHLPDGAVLDLMERAPTDGKADIGKMLSKGLHMNKIEMLVETETATSWALGFKRVYGPLSLTAANWTVEPGYSCAKSFLMTADLTVAQVTEGAAVCNSLAAR